MKLRKNEIASPQNFPIPRWKIRICSEDFWDFLGGGWLLALEALEALVLLVKLGSLISSPSNL